MRNFLSIGLVRWAVRYRSCASAGQSASAKVLEHEIRSFPGGHGEIVIEREAGGAARSERMVAVRQPFDPDGGRERIGRHLRAVAERVAFTLDDEGGSRKPFQVPRAQPSRVCWRVKRVAE